MNERRPRRKKMIKLLVECLLLGCLALQPAAACGMGQPDSRSLTIPTDELIQVIIYEPALDPAFGDCMDTYWMSYPNSLGFFTYVTTNTEFNPYNSGTWTPNIPQEGLYRVEAFIADHPDVEFCNPQVTYKEDSHNARYEIHHKNGITLREISQYPLADEWLYLGVYEFAAGTEGKVILRDLTKETKLTKTVNFSAMRFTWVEGSISYFPLFYKPPVIPTGDEIQVMQAQGFDLCIPPSVNKMNTWWNYSPYYIFGLYLGGSNFASGCDLVDAAWLSQVRAIGWTFIPTWVGPQAPCSVFYPRFSYDLNTAYAQGRQEADLAVAAAASMGLLPTADSKTILYYDLEGYNQYPDHPLETECRNASLSFLNGWSTRLHERGFKSAAYGSSCGSFVYDWLKIPDPLNDVWLANWYEEEGSYDPDASVYDVSCISNYVWTDHQRIRQYAGEFVDSWGGVSLAIDADVADGEVAAPNILLLSQAAAAPLEESDPTIQDFQFFDPEQGWVLSEGSLFWTADGGDTWMKPLEQRVLAATFIDPGWGTVLVEPKEKGAAQVLYRYLNQAWEALPNPLPPGDWQVKQMEFSTPETGWIVLRRKTNSAIQQGLLLVTQDGGTSWLTYPLSPAKALFFTAPDQAWMPYGNAGERLFSLNIDGGKAVQDEASAERPDLSLQDIPAGITLSAGTRSWLIERGLPSILFDGLPAAPVRTFFIDENTAWALVQDGTCTGDKNTPGFSCRRTVSLWQTEDQGASWQGIRLP